MRRSHEPVIDQDWSLGNPAATGDGIKAGEKVGAAVDLMDEAWWFPAIRWPDGRMQFMLNERMIPGQFVVNGHGRRFVNEAAPYTDFGHAVIAGQRGGVQHIPAWRQRSCGLRPWAQATDRAGQVRPDSTTRSGGP